VFYRRGAVGPPGLCACALHAGVHGWDAVAAVPFGLGNTGGLRLDCPQTAARSMVAQTGGRPTDMFPRKGGHGRATEEDAVL